MLGLTQQQMAELIGVTYQQAHKYEKGVNRIAGGRLTPLPRRSASRSATSTKAWIPSPAGSNQPSNSAWYSSFA